MISQEKTRKTGLDIWRIRAFQIVSGLFFIWFALRLFSLQIIQSNEWEILSNANRVNLISIPTQRGVIYDRNGIVLAQNVATYNLAVIPAFLPDDDAEVEEIVARLAQFTDLPIHAGDVEEDLLIQCGGDLGIYEMIQKGLTFSPFDPVLIECDIPREQAIAIQEMAMDWPGVIIDVLPVRDYPTGYLTAPILGFLGPITASQEDILVELGFVSRRDKIGYAGIEYYFDELLRGLPGRRVVEVDVAGEIQRDIEAVRQPIDGYNLNLTIDLRLQQATTAILEREVNFWNQYLYGSTGEILVSSAAVIAMDPTTGEILAMVSYPSYENNRMAQFIPSYYYEQLTEDSTQPLINNTVGQQFPIGSVFKLVTGVGALNERVVEPNQFIDTPPFIEIQNYYTPNNPADSRRFVDWYDPGFGQLDFRGGLSNSSNVYFYQLGGGYPGQVEEGLGICRLQTYAEALGYNDYLGVELAEEVTGIVPDPTWKRINQGENWSIGDTYLASVGQGFIIGTPLQVAVSAAVIANDGVLVRPTLVRDVVDNEGNVISVVTDPAGILLDLPVMTDGEVLGILFDEDYHPVETVVISPFVPDERWDLTQDAMIQVYEDPTGIGACQPTGEMRTIDPWVFDVLQEGMRLAVTEGTLSNPVTVGGVWTVPTAGKTGTAEYCDEAALLANRCEFGNWPSHAWTVAYAPYENPEIVVVAFMYNGTEGASVAAPVVRQVIDAYFNIRQIDVESGSP